MIQIVEKGLSSFSRNLLRVPSPSGQEKEIAKVVAAEMKAAGFGRVRGRVEQRGRSHKGKIPVPLMLNGHIDHAGGSMKNPIPGKIMEREGRTVIWGRGACDMKGAVAAMVFAGKAVMDSGVKLKSSAVLTAVSLEEAGRGEGIKRLLGEEKIRADMAISGEATNLQINLGHRGKLEFDVLAKGKTTHGSTPSLGINAIFQMKKFIEKLETAYQLPVDPFFGPCTVTAIDISASPGRLTPIVPDRCNLVVDRRYLPSESAESVKRELEGLIRQVQAEDPQFEAEVSLAKNFPPYYCRPEEEVVKILQEPAGVLGEEGRLGLRFGGRIVHPPRRHPARASVRHEICTPRGLCPG
jgi:acetylornithine deacetylase/succinyl-diaminopimelate desuccinylase-like protein